MEETRTRSLVKALTFRVIASAITAAIVLVITKDGRIAAGAGVADGVIKIVVYYLHERVWLLIPMGKR